VWQASIGAELVRSQVVALAEELVFVLIVTHRSNLVIFSYLTFGARFLVAVQ
jgi:hypothetical protein